MVLWGVKIVLPFKIWGKARQIKCLNPLSCEIPFERSTDQKIMTLRNVFYDIPS